MTFLQEGSRLLAIGRTDALTESFKQLISTYVSDGVSIDTLCYKHFFKEDNPPLRERNSYNTYTSIFLTVDRSDASSESLAIIETLRTGNLHHPIIYVVLSGGGHYDKVKYYLAGADYCVKPAPAGEKCTSDLSEILNHSPDISQRPLVLDLTRLRISGAQEKLDISFTETKVLEALVRSCNHVLSHDELASIMGLNVNFYDPRALEKSISRLRGKIKTHFNINALQSVRGYGYRLTRGLLSPTR